MQIRVRASVVAIQQRHLVYSTSHCSAAGQKYGKGAACLCRQDWAPTPLWQAGGRGRQALSWLVSKCGHGYVGVLGPGVRGH